MRLVFEQKKKPHHVATLKKGGQTFEVLIVPDKAIDFRRGTITDVSEALEIEGVFKDARSGEKPANLLEVFGTEDESVIAAEIIRKGTIQLTSEYRKSLQEQKRKEVVNIIATNGIDPRNNLPIPATRIELALEQVNFNFDPFKSGEEQVNDVLEVLRPVLAVRFEERTIEGFVGPKYGGKAAGSVSKYGKIIKSEWMSDGSWHFVIRIPGGLQDEVIKALNDATHGEVNITQR